MFHLRGDLDRFVNFFGCVKLGLIPRDTSLCSPRFRSSAVVLVSKLVRGDGAVPLVLIGFGSLMGASSGDVRSLCVDRRSARPGLMAPSSLLSEGMRLLELVCRVLGKADGQSAFRSSSRELVDVELILDSLLR